MATNTSIIGSHRVVCFIGFNLTKETPNIDIYFYVLGALIGLVMGAIQSLARSTYSKMLPKTEDTASYFSFFDVTEKIALVIGMVTFGILNSMISIQSSVLALAVFFLAAFISLSRIKKTEYVH